MTCRNCLSEFTPRKGGKPQEFCDKKGRGVCQKEWWTMARRVGIKVILGGRIGRQKQKAGKTVFAFSLRSQVADQRVAFFRAAREMLQKRGSGSV